MAAAATTMVTLQSKDGEQFTVSRRAIRNSGLLEEMLIDLPTLAATDIIPVPECSGAQLKMILEWCEKHVEDPDAALESGEVDPMTLEIPAWDRDFLPTDIDELCALASATNYLEIKLLQAMCCKTIANIIKGKSTQEMREILGIESDFTPEEEDHIRQENAWASSDN